MNFRNQAKNMIILERLRSAARKKKRPAANQDAGVPYDFHTPHNFNRSQKERLEAFGRTGASAAGEALDRLLQGRTEVILETVRERFTDQLSRETGTLYLPVLSNGDRIGLVRVPGAVAVQWVEHLLGGRADGEVRELSSVESALLTDIVGAIASALSWVSTDLSGPGLQTGDDVLSPEAAIDDEDRRAYLELVFQAYERPEEDDEEDGELLGSAVDDEATADEDDGGTSDDVPGDAAEFAVILRSNLLWPIASPEVLERPEPSREDIRAWVREHLDRAPLAAHAVLGKSDITVRDLMALGPGDVVLLKQQVSEPVPLQVTGETTVCRGKPGICEGRYALQIQDIRQFPRLGLPVAGAASERSAT